jgi:hypothetical protein
MNTFTEAVYSANQGAASGNEELLAEVAALRVQVAALIAQQQKGNAIAQEGFGSVSEATVTAGESMAREQRRLNDRLALAGR